MMNTRTGNTKKHDDSKKILFTANTANIYKSELGDTTLQVNFSNSALEAVDSILGICGGDVLLCETTCLEYAAHVAAAEGKLKELWLIPPLPSGVRPDFELQEEFENELLEEYGEFLDSLQASGAAFKGVTFSVPDAPFKLLITTQYCGMPIQSATEWPEYNSFWIDMLNTDGATGAVVYPPLDDQSEKDPSLREDNLHPGNFVTAVELPGGRVVLGLGKPGESILMVDLSDPDSPWSREITPLALAVNDGCLVPSIHRAGVEVIAETTFEELATRISRGTSLSEKDLEIKEKLNSRVVKRPHRSVEKNDGKKEQKKKQFRGIGFSGSAYATKDKWAYALDDDLFYVDGSCFHDGEIWPAVLESIPKGQERYIVDQHDGEVLLVSRNSKQPAVYEAVRPTLIANSVFVIRFNTEISRDYLACWMRGWFAKRWLHDGGKILSKGALSSLPIPILDEGIMEQVVHHEQSIDEKIFDLREEIGKLESGNRFAPLAAIREADSR